LDTGIYKYIILPLICLHRGNNLWIEGNTFKINKRLFPIHREEKYWRNIIRIIHAYVPGSIKKKKIQFEIEGEERIFYTNGKGHFKFELKNYDLNKSNINSIKFYRLKGNEKIRIGIPEPIDHCFFSFNRATTGIISDIDDTILVTHTRNIIKKLKTLLTKNAYKRYAVKEMRAFYESLSKKERPFFYVSNSEANLYPMIRLFLKHNNFPKGPIFLKPFVKWSDLFKRKTSKGRDGHKHKKIMLLLESFPHMKFILIGDDSQKDPEIYGEIARHLPERIEHIYIRNINKKQLSKRLSYADNLKTNYNVNITFFKSPANALINQKNMVNS